MLKTLTLNDIKTKGSKVIPSDAVSYLIVNSKVKSVLLPQKIYETLMGALEELEDRKAIESRKGEKDLSFAKVAGELDK